MGSFASGSAFQVQPAGGVEADPRLPTPSKKRTKLRDDSPDSGRRFWATHADVESAYDDHSCHKVYVKVGKSARKAEKMR